MSDSEVGYARLWRAGSEIDMLVDAALPQKSESLFSFTPGFSPVTNDRSES